MQASDPALAMMQPTHAAALIVPSSGLQFETMFTGQTHHVAEHQHGFPRSILSSERTGDWLLQPGDVPRPSQGPGRAVPRERRLRRVAWTVAATEGLHGPCMAVGPAHACHCTTRLPQSVDLPRTTPPGACGDVDMTPSGGGVMADDRAHGATRCDHAAAMDLSVAGPIAHES